MNERDRLASGGVCRRTARRNVKLVATALLTTLCLAGCASTPGKISSKTAAAKAQVDPKYGVKPSPRVVAEGPIPKGGGREMVGKPYQVAGKRYVPKHDPNYTATGLASWYGDAFHGRYTANGEIYDMTHLSAAHTTMPLPSYARVTSTDTGRSVIVRVNDRGPFHGKRIMDLSKRAADMLGIRRAGVAKIKVAYVGPAPKEGDDTPFLVASYRGPAAPATVDAPATMIARNDAVPGVTAKPAPARSAPAAVAVAAPVQVATITAIPRERPTASFETYAVVASVDPADAFSSSVADTMMASADVPTLTVTRAAASVSATGFDPSLVQKASLTVPAPEAAPVAATVPVAAPAVQAGVPAGADQIEMLIDQQSAPGAVPLPPTAPVLAMTNSYAADRIDQAYGAFAGFDGGLALADAPEAPAATAPAATPSAALQAALVEVGVFANRDNAGRLAERLSSIGSVDLSSVVSGGRELTRVRITALAAGVSPAMAVEAAVKAGATGAFARN